MHKFIERMMLRNVGNAALQRVGVYNDGVAPALELASREDLKAWLRQLGLCYYVWEYDSESYCNEIESLKHHLLTNHGMILRRMTIGICQKSICR